MKEEGCIVRKVLCVCIGNTCRSPMMQVLLQQQLGNEFQVESAGVRKESAGKPANDNSILCMQERGIDLTNHRSRWVGDLNLTQYSHVICVGDNEAQQISEYLGQESKVVVLIANGEHGGVPNPHKKGVPAYLECLAVLDDTMPKIADTLR